MERQIQTLISPVWIAETLSSVGPFFTFLGFHINVLFACSLPSIYHPPLLMQDKITGPTGGIATATFLWLW